MEWFQVRKYIEIDAGHRVPYHASKCQNLHGHRYRVTLEVMARNLVPADERQLSDAGMVVDFSFMKEVLMREVHDVYDHKLILWQRDPLREVLKDHRGIVVVPVMPTAEALARYWGGSLRALVYDTMRRERETRSLTVSAIEVRETPTSFARWETGD